MFSKIANAIVVKPTNRHGDDYNAFITRDGDENIGYILQEDMRRMASISKMGNFKPIRETHLHQD